MESLEFTTSTISTFHTADKEAKAQISVQAQRDRREEWVRGDNDLFNAGVKRQCEQWRDGVPRGLQRFQ
jgi:hypothetical protein